MSAPLLEVRDLTIDIDTRYGQARIVDGVTFSVLKGETLGVVGESGCGKEPDHDVTARSLAAQDCR